MDMGLRLLRTLNISILEALGNALTCNRIGAGRVHFHLQASRPETKQPGKVPAFMYRLAFPPDYESVLTFMHYAYVKHDPVLSVACTGNEDSYASVLDIIRAQIEEGLTIVAVDEENCLVGAAVNVGSCPWDGEKAREYARCCQTGRVRDVIEFFAHVTCKPDLWRMFDVYKIFECSCFAVEPAARSCGIGRRLLEESWVLARDCGYRLFRIDCTSMYTSQIAENFGWQRVLTIPYCRYVKNGELVFKDIPEPHTELRVYVDRLSHCKTYYPPYRTKPSCPKKTYVWT